MKVSMRFAMIAALVAFWDYPALSQPAVSDTEDTIGIDHDRLPVVIPSPYVRSTSATHTVLRTGGLFFERSRAEPDFIFSNSTPRAIGPPALGLNSGPNVELTLHRPGFDLALGYFGLFTGADVFPGTDEPDGLVIPDLPSGGLLVAIPTSPALTFPPSNTRPETVFKGTYKATLHSAELCAARDVNEHTRIFSGFRWIALDERLTYVVGAEDSFSSNFHGNGSVVDVENDIYGFQWGLECETSQHRRLRLNALAKAGLGYNPAEHSSLISKISEQTASVRGVDVELVETRDKKVQLAFLGQIELAGVWQLNNVLALRMGYQLMWIDGLAFAPDQVSATNRYTRSGIDTSGSALWHGGLAQIEMTW